MSEPKSDPQQAATSEVLGLLAYGELMAFERLAEHAKWAPSLGDRAFQAQLAVTEFGHFTRLREHLISLGADPMAAMAPFQDALDNFHTNTAPHDWLEGLVKAYVGDGLTSDFYAEIANHLDSTTKEIVVSVLDRPDVNEFLVSRVLAGIEADPKAAGRLALWGRRLVGEALSQAQLVAADRDDLSGLLAGENSTFDLVEIGRMFTRLTEAHSQRMKTLGLAS